jgi:ATP-dependent Lhr-like helicase
MNRLRSQKLLSAVSRYEDFPILLETWRTCLVDEFDLVSLKQVLTELESGLVRWSEVNTSYPSPMAQHIVWRQTNQYMYMGDEPAGQMVSNLRDDLIRHVVLTPDLRPTISPELVTQFEQKRQRLAPGYSPEEPRELVDWVKERVAIPEAEWQALLDAMQRDHGIDLDGLLKAVDDRLMKIRPAGAGEPLVVALEGLGRVAYGMSGTAEVPVTSILGHPADKQPVTTPEADRDEVLTTLLGEWLQFYGPIDPTTISITLGIDPDDLSMVLDDLADSQTVIAGQLVTGAVREQVCDSENFEVLLRLARRAAVPAFEARETEWLPFFLARYQGVGAPNGDVDALFRCLEHLRCLPLEAGLWEAEVLPARLHGYLPSWLDAIMQEGNLRWIGGEKRTVALGFEEDLPLLREEAAGAAASEGGSKSIFPDALGRYDFSTLLQVTGLRPDELSDRLWHGVWRGQVTNDTFAALRKGIATRFAAPRIAPASERGRRSSRRGLGRSSGVSFSRWRASMPFAGNWLLLPATPPPEDLLESEEQMKDRVRVLLDRYGILFRELIEREAPLFRWGKVFRALRLMELSGELLAGYFFKGIPGLQFMAPRAFQMLQGKLPENEVCWLNAMDPASLCGVQVEAFKGELPRRIAGNHMVYHGTRLVVVSQQNGRNLTINVPHYDQHLMEYLGFLRHLLSRQFQPLHRITIETINGEPATDSPYLAALKVGFDVMVQTGNVVLYRKTGAAKA